jgi:hypothetical protein
VLQQLDASDAEVLRRLLADTEQRAAHRPNDR